MAVALLWIAIHATRPTVGVHFDLYEYQRSVEVPRWTQVGMWLRSSARKGESLAAVPIGAVSYYSGLTVYDMLGLTDKHIAHRRMPDMGSGWAGHEKHDGPYILGLRPTYLLLGNIDMTDQPRDVRDMPFIPYFSPAIWNREKDMYESNVIQTLYRPRSVEIAPGQFFNFYELRDEYRSRPQEPRAPRSQSGPTSDTTVHSSTAG